jgi:hypothetical protein
VLALGLRAEGAASSLPQSLPIQYSPKTSWNVTASFDVNRPVDVLSRLTLQRLGRHAVSKLAVGGPPSGWAFTDEDGNPIPAPTGQWIHATVSIPAVGVRSMRAMWEADIAIASLREQLAVRSEPISVIGSQIVGRLPNGREAVIGGGLGAVVLGQDFGDKKSGVVENKIRRRSAEAGLEIVSVEVLHPVQDAPAVVAITDDPAVFVAEADERILALFGERGSYEAEYLEVRDSSGRPVFVQASSFRTGVGRRWVRPDLDPRRVISQGADDPTKG